MANHLGKPGVCDAPAHAKLKWCGEAVKRIVHLVMSDRQTAQKQNMTLLPEATYIVTITDDAIVHKRPDGFVERIPLPDICRVVVETNDSGPWGMDVWWIIHGKSSQERVCFPQGATGEAAIIKYLANLPGFEIRGMNSTANASFECWPHPLK